MKTKPTYPEVRHYYLARPCCETPTSTDLFPDLLNLSTNHKHRGRIASIVIESRGIGILNRSIAIDETAWAKCIESPHFRSCYDLSMAKLALQSAFTSR